MLLTLIKCVSEIACVVGSEVIVGAIVKSAKVADTTNKALNACSKVATFCVAGVLGAEAAKYADKTIDETAEAIKQISSAMTQTQQEGENGAA